MPPDYRHGGIKKNTNNFWKRGSGGGEGIYWNRVLLLGLIWYSLYIQTRGQAVFRVAMLESVQCSKVCLIVLTSHLRF